MKDTEIPSSSSAGPHPSVSASGLLIHSNLPDIRLERFYCFRSSLQRLQYAGSQLPPSSSPCRNCEKKRVKCICESVATQVGQMPAFSLPEAEKVRAQLDQVRQRLSSIEIAEWKRHTNATDVMKRVLPTIREKVKDSMGFAPELVINSWAKLYEILAQTPALPPLPSCLSSQGFLDSHGARTPAGPCIKSVHLCECPGGFIAATNHFIKTKTKGALGHLWRAVSLSPYHEGGNPSELLDDDVLYRQTEDLWLTGYDETGDIVKKRNIEFIWNHTSREPRTRDNPAPFGLADLVTADGSFDVQFAPHLQEELTAPLVFAEVVCMLGLLNIRGTGIVKMYGLLSHQSISILAILSMCFNHVVLAKPSMSRPGNSELYAVCLEFVGIRSSFLSVLSRLVDSVQDVLGKQGKTIIPKNWLPEEFLQECVEGARFFASHQIQQIDRNLGLFRQLDQAALQRCLQRQREKATEFLRRNKIEPINFQDRIVKDVHFMTDWAKNPFTNSTRRATRRRVQGTLADRERGHALFEALHSARRRQWEAAARRIDGDSGGERRGRTGGRLIPFVKPEAAVEAVCAFVEAQRRSAEETAQNGEGAVERTDSLAEYLELLPRSGDRNDGEEPQGERDSSTPGVVVSKRLPFWLNHFGRHLKPRRSVSSKSRGDSDTRNSGSDLLSFFAGISGHSQASDECASASAEAPGAEDPDAEREEAEHEEEEGEEEKEQRERWTKELSKGLHRKDYLRSKSRWITPALAIRPFAVRLSRFADDQFMALLMEKRLRLPFVLPYLPSDYLVSEGDHSPPSPVAARCLSLPSSFTVDLALALLRLCPASPPSVASERAALPGRQQRLDAWRGRLAQRYPSGYLELSSLPETEGDALHSGDREAGERQGAGVLQDLFLRAEVQLRGSLLLNGVSSRDDGEAEVDSRGGSSSGDPPPFFDDFSDWGVDAETDGRQRRCEAAVGKQTGEKGVVHLDLLGEFERGTKSAELIQKFTSKCLSAVGLVYADVTRLEQTDSQHASQRQTSFPLSPSSPSSFFELREGCEVERAFMEIAEAEMRSGVLLVGQLLEAMTVLESNGDLILRLHSVYMRFTASLLLLLSSAFSNAAFFAPASLPSWRNQRFFLGYSLRPIEAGETKKILGAVWDALVDLQSKRNREEDERQSREGSAGANGRNARNDDAPAWTVSQCLPSKLFTSLVPSTWLCQWNDFFLLAQIRDVDRRLKLFAAARRVLSEKDCPSPSLSTAARCSEANEDAEERMQKRRRCDEMAPVMQASKQQTPETEKTSEMRRAAPDEKGALEEQIASALFLRTREKREKIVVRFLEKLGVGDFLLPEASPFRQLLSRPASQKTQRHTPDAEAAQSETTKIEEEPQKKASKPWEHLLTEAAESADRAWGNVKFLSLESICQAAVGEGLQRENEASFWRSA
ncbi:ribosomal RNA large subunit methyltransferase J protein [Toxoplasma gondii ARI]|uniref:Cap-specific mRNA (nucleoside-2'-O-)-methyltransferase 2 n=1 Tax=Toxoplasma gondii ARI TaxID=1074872 RepID=A0A139XNV4_TOXGO|nr:ribosomal RNA large subunit methyltransferase J protein [Toxoplasma gondii ARI]